jgi:RimJ/RimL family protein N-acetyltransferase
MVQKYKYKDILLEQRCRYKTKRLSVESWKHLKYTPMGEKAVAEKIINFLTAETTETLPKEWREINTIERAIAWIKKRDEESAVFTIQFLSRSEIRKIIGFLLLHEEDSAEFDGTKLRIGYLLSKNVWGKGLGGELIKGLVEWCKRAGDIASISGAVAVANLASIKILEKNGFSISTSEKPPKNMVILERKFDIRQ